MDETKPYGFPPKQSGIISESFYFSAGSRIHDFWGVLRGQSGSSNHPNHASSPNHFDLGRDPRSKIAGQDLWAILGLESGSVLILK